jgi:hypothetical protein
MPEAQSLPITAAAVVMRADSYVVAAASVLIMDKPERTRLAQ